MSKTNEIVTQLILILGAFALGFFSAFICIGLLIEFNIKEALTVKTQQSAPLSSDYK